MFYTFPLPGPIAHTHSLSLSLTLSPSSALSLLQEEEEGEGEQLIGSIHGDAWGQEPVSTAAKGGRGKRKREINWATTHACVGIGGSLGASIKGFKTLGRMHAAAGGGSRRADEDGDCQGGRGRGAGRGRGKGSALLQPAAERLGGRGSGSGQEQDEEPDAAGEEQDAAETGWGAGISSSRRDGVAAGERGGSGCVADGGGGGWQRSDARTDVPRDAGDVGGSDDGAGDSGSGRACCRAGPPPSAATSLTGLLSALNQASPLNPM